uniref:Zinc finger family protein n=1 Tax=Rhizophora mucronata TaxID=61149 RepID=A0A2P2KTV9_RHIMU
MMNSPFQSLLDDTNYEATFLHPVEVLQVCLPQILSLSSHLQILELLEVEKLGG